MKRSHVVLLVSLLLWTLYPAAGFGAPPAGFVQFEGTFTDNDGTGWKGPATERQVQLLVPPRPGVPVMRFHRGGNAGARPAAPKASIVIRDGASGKIWRTYQVANSYASSDVECWLGTSGALSCALVIQHAPNRSPAELSQPEKLQAKFLVSDRPTWIAVNGTSRKQLPRRAH
jgi:hypothetical protein